MGIFSVKFLPSPFVYQVVNHMHTARDEIKYDGKYKKIQ